MGSQMLKISPFAASRTFIAGAPALASPEAPNCRIIRYGSYLAGEFCGLTLNQGKKGFRCGVVAMAATNSVQKSEEEWRAILSHEQFRILRLKGTELPGSGRYDRFFRNGTYGCAGCGTPLYKSTAKFHSRRGWPAFFEGLPGAINRTPDPDGHRVEITCAACGGHLGHVFKGEGYRTPTDERHCVNSGEEMELLRSHQITIPTVYHHHKLIEECHLLRRLLQP